MRAFSQVTWPSPGRERTSTLAPTKATLQLGAQEWSRSERPRDRAVPMELPIPSVSSVELISSLKTQHLKRIVRKKFEEEGPRSGKKGKRKVKVFNTEGVGPNFKKGGGRDKLRTVKAGKISKKKRK